MTPEEIKLKAENDYLRRELNLMREELERTRQQLTIAEKKIRIAKDINPVEKPSFKRVSKLVADCCMSLQKVADGWILSMGKLTRKFKFIRQIWELLNAENFYLEDIFAAPAPKVQTVAPKVRSRNASIFTPSLPDSGLPFGAQSFVSSA